MKLLIPFPNRRIFVGLFAAISTAGMVQTAPAADEKPTIPIIVKDTTSNYWQMVLAGARKAGKDLNVNVPELGAQSPSDIDGQISLLENTVSGRKAKSRLTKP
jgi:ribose transport system substrate-binding protein